MTQFDSVFVPDIEKMDKKQLTDLWKSTDFGSMYETSYFGEAPEYDGDMIADIRDEILPLILIDLNCLYDS